jgi:hypothetical protein
MMEEPFSFEISYRRCSESAAASQAVDYLHGLQPEPAE